MVLALTVVFPWALSLAKIEGKLSLSPASIKSIYLGDQLITLRASQTGAPMNEISQAMHQEDFNGYSGIRCDALKYENPEKVKEKSKEKNHEITVSCTSNRTCGKNCCSGGKKFLGNIHYTPLAKKKRLISFSGMATFDFDRPRDIRNKNI